MSEILLGAIWAQAANGVIGRAGDMPWYAPEDLAHFKQVTGSCPVLMGRATWESIPERFRPLPGRANLVVSSSASRPGEEKDGALWFPSLVKALNAGVELAQEAGQNQLWIMGGASIYTQALELDNLAGITGGGVCLIERTVFGQEASGDAFAPALGADWQLAAHGDWTASDRGYLLAEDGEKQELTYRFETWRRA